MEREFLPFELSVKLKELGFKDKCLGSYDLNKDFYIGGSDYKINIWINAPLWQQAFDWFRNKYNLPSWCFKSDKWWYKIEKGDWWYGNTYDEAYETYEEVRQSCLEKLIELVEYDQT